MSIDGARSQSMSELGDDELLAAVRAGDRDAYGSLYERHAPSARRYARALLANRPDADDAVGEVFAAAAPDDRAGSWARPHVRRVPVRQRPARVRPHRAPPQSRSARPSGTAPGRPARRRRRSCRGRGRGGRRAGGVRLVAGRDARHPPPHRGRPAPAAGDRHPPGRRPRHRGHPRHAGPPCARERLSAPARRHRRPPAPTGHRLPGHPVAHRVVPPGDDRLPSPSPDRGAPRDVRCVSGRVCRPAPDQRASAIGRLRRPVRRPHGGGGRVGPRRGRCRGVGGASWRRRGSSRRRRSPRSWSLHHLRRRRCRPHQPWSSQRRCGRNCTFRPGW